MLVWGLGHHPTLPLGHSNPALPCSRNYIRWVVINQIIWWENSRALRPNTLYGIFTENRTPPKKLYVWRSRHRRRRVELGVGLWYPTPQLYSTRDLGSVAHRGPRRGPRPKLDSVRCWPPNSLAAAERIFVNFLDMSVSGTFISASKKRHGFVWAGVRFQRQDDRRGLALQTGPGWVGRPVPSAVA